MDSRRVVSNIFSGSIGNLVEWYDWYVYAAFSLYFAKAFFPKGDDHAQLLNTAAIFAVGLPDAADRRLADRPVRRPARPQRRADAVGHPDVRPAPW